jgi:pyruvate,water dikinase
MVAWLGGLFGSRSRRNRRAFAEVLRRYDAFLQLLRSNAEALELMADLEAAAGRTDPGGLDHLERTVRGLAVQVFAMAQTLDRLTSGRYPSLAPKVEKMGQELEARLLAASPPVPGAIPRVMTWTELEDTPESWVGGKNANLGRLLAAHPFPFPPGFAVTVRGFRETVAHNGLEETARVLWDTLDPEEPAGLLETSALLKEALRSGKVPETLARELAGAAGRLAEQAGGDLRLAVRSSATGEDASFSFAGLYDSVLNVSPEDLPRAYLEVLAGAFNPRAMLLRLSRGFGALELSMGVQVMVQVLPRCSGVAYSRDPSSEFPQDCVRVEAVEGHGGRLVDGSSNPAVLLLRRSSLEVASAGGAGAPPGFSPQLAAEVARLALDAESALKSPADVEWAVDAADKLWILQARPLALRPPPSGPVPAPVPGFEIIVQGGACASAGTACGPVVRAGSPNEALSAKAGAVLVAVEASPDLALAVPRAAALVAERGGTTGHLASVAREFGVPALFGVPGALSLLGEEEEVTVDASALRVYRGRVAQLLSVPPPRTLTALPPSPVALTARDLLPLVSPLSLTDPSDPRFSPEGVATFHDAIRFIHEKSLEAMVALPELLEAGGGRGIRVDAPLPLDLRLVPLGSGVEGRKGGGAVTLGQVTSAPARALLEGLLDERVRRTGPRPVDPSGFLAVVGTAFTTDTTLGAPSWAFVADHYLHLSSRIGYHFTTLEAFAGPREQDNRIRFGFKGGAADEPRRRRRVELMAKVAQGMGFQTRVKGDFMAATYAQAPGAQVLDRLRELGRLLVCTLQLDMVLSSDDLVDFYAEGFLEQDYGRLLDARRPSD